jgi:hypothetical protein
MMRRALALVALLVALADPGAAVACDLSWRITGAGLPLAGVEIAETRLDGAPRTLGLTGADGALAVAVAPLPASQHALKIVLRKPPFEETALLFGKDAASGCPNPAHRDVDLGRPAAAGGGAGGAAAAEAPDTCAQPSVGGRTIFVAPYEIYGAADNALASALNGDLPEIVYHRILAFGSRLGGVRTDDISVVPICAALSAAHGEKIRSVGAALNALAVIAGDGELRAAAGSGANGSAAVVDLESVFRVLPVWQDLGGSALQIGDTIPAARLRPSRVAEGLTDLWGKQAVFALALRRLAEPHAPDTERDVHRLLIELRKTMQMDDPLLPDVQSVLARLDAGAGR